jgi:hypothetical protein
MKVLTVQQPWASLIVHGGKPWEYRSWPTRHRGPLAIHASRCFGDRQRRLCVAPAIKPLLDAAGIAGPGALPLGCILGAVRVIDCIAEREGGFAWRLADPVRLPAPVPYRGQLGLCDLPADIATILADLVGSLT